ncbi:hypothetical protein ACFLWO_00310 [Chloroflexota bacterium]
MTGGSVEKYDCEYPRYAEMSNSTIELYTRYPLRNILTYNGITIIHYILGGIGIIIGYGSWIGYLFGIGYVVLAFSEMYIHMPLKVCPNCVYVRLENSLCISGLNIVSKKLTPLGNTEDFSNRAIGALCPNNLYIASLVIPIIAMVPALIINFSVFLLIIFLIVIGLLLFRFFVIFPRVACIHCRAKNICPQAQSMFREKSRS